jgi:hypothetical protein
MSIIARSIRWHIHLMLACAVAACGGHNTASNVQAPGIEGTAKTRLLETAAAVVQKKPPIDALNVYLDGFHFYNGRIQAQVEAHHFCSIVNEEVIQCVIFDGNTSEAKLMGVEYIISKHLFETLPSDEKLLWHSHVHEVKSGQLIAPGIPAWAEHEVMEKIIGTYGKTWHIWHTDQNLALPEGQPLLMMGFTAPGQAHADMVHSRDQRFNIHSQDKRKERESITAPPIAPGADAWQQGLILQLSMEPLQQNPDVHHLRQTDPSSP